MKLRILLLALFIAGLASSLALAAPGHGRGGDGSTTTAAHGKGKHEDAGKKADVAGTGCHNVSLKGTLGAGTLSLDVTKGNKAAKALLKTKVTLAFSGNASVVARLCGTGDAQTLTLRVLKVAKPASSNDSTTTTTTTTVATTTP